MYLGFIEFLWSMGYSFYLIWSFQSFFLQVFFSVSHTLFSETPVTCMLGCLKLYYSFPDTVFFLSVCFILDSFYRYAFRFTNLFFLSMSSAANFMQYIFHLRHCSLHLGLSCGSFNLSYIDLTCSNFPLSSWTYGIVSVLISLSTTSMICGISESNSSNWLLSSLEIVFSWFLAFL